jgi:hypothetical protein
MWSSNMAVVRTFSAAFVMKGDVGLERGHSLYLCNAPGCSMIRIQVDSNIRLRDYIWPTWIKIQCTLQTVTKGSPKHMLLSFQQLWKCSTQTLTNWRRSFTSYTCAKYKYEYVIRQEIIKPTAYIPGILLSLKERQVHLLKKSYLNSKFPTKLRFRKSRIWTHNYAVCPNYSSPKFATHYHKIWYCGSTLEVTGLILAYVLVYDSSRTLLHVQLT